MSVNVMVPETVPALDAVRELMRAFVAWHRERHQQDLHLIDRYFDPVAFDAELASLPGKYSPPHGQILLAYTGDEPAGCVALRGLDEQVCEMKRMFVYPQLHGRGVGKALADAIMEEAKRLEYRTMVLDTSIRQREAQTLYRRLGFQPTEPYYELEDDVRDWLVFMKREL